MPIGVSEFTDGLSAPATAWAAVVPSDSADLPNPCRALWVGSGGNVSVVSASGQVATLSNVPAGTMLPLRVARVRATGTSATGIVALW